MSVLRSGFIIDPQAPVESIREYLDGVELWINTNPSSTAYHINKLDEYIGALKGLLADFESIELSEEDREALGEKCSMLLERLISLSEIANSNFTKGGKRSEDGVCDPLSFLK